MARGLINKKATKTKFKITKKDFLAPYKLKAKMNDIVAEHQAKGGKTEGEINDYLQMIDED